MSSSDKFCLKWNDFQEHVSITFQQLRLANEFADVTLACENNEQIEVHKVILSAASPFFRTILTQNKHPHPLIYMKGIKATDLAVIVDFIYNGEVNVYQDNLNYLLSIAEDLKIKGLSGPAMENKQVFPTPDIIPELTPTLQDNIPTMETTHEIQDTNEEIILQENVKVDPEYETVVMEERSFVSFKDGDEELDEKIKSLMDRMEGLWSCKMCQYTAKYITHMKRHIEGRHIDGLSYPCGMCGNTFSSRNCLQAHLSRKHKA